MSSLKLLIVTTSCLLFTSCASQYHTDTINPQISCRASQLSTNHLPSAFKPLNEHEKATPWGIEYTVALGFAKTLDYYRAVTAFKRSSMLMDSNSSRKLEAEYFTFLSYYLGEQYDEAIATFEKGPLSSIDSSFTPYRDVLLALHESYLKTQNEAKSDHILKVMEHHDQEVSHKLRLAHAATLGHVKQLRQFAYNETSQKASDQIVNAYTKYRKSPQLASALNVVPGMGYYYLGQNQAAMTSVLLNSLFIASAYQFFRQGQVTAGVITTSFELGWYVSGIYGAGLSAKKYNERLYEYSVQSTMEDKDLYPVFSLKYAF